MLFQYSIDNIAAILVNCYRGTYYITNNDFTGNRFCTLGIIGVNRQSVMKPFLSIRVNGPTGV